MKIDLVEMIVKLPALHEPEMAVSGATSNPTREPAEPRAANVFETLCQSVTTRHRNLYPTTLAHRLRVSVLKRRPKA